VVATYVAVWFVLAAVAFLVVFLGSSRTTTLASHDAVVRPTLTGKSVVHTGPVLPDLRIDSGSRIGVDIRLGKTDAESTDALLQRYAAIAAQPDGPTKKVNHLIAGMAFDAALRGAILGVVPILVWVLLGTSRRRELWHRIRTRQGILAGALVLLIGVGLWEPWVPREDTVEAGQDWMPLATFLGPEIPLPDEVTGVEVRGDVTTASTRRLIASAVDAYDKAQTFSAEAVAAAATLPLRRPEQGEAVVVLIADRHDNTSMDAVARAVGDRAGATAVFDAGDDTSTGKTWEAFSLDSVDAAFDDLGRWGVAGNHDHGTFVSGYLADLGWTMLDGQVVGGPGGSTIIGADDPRSSGLGSWRDETGLTFDEVGTRLADATCDSEQRVSTVLVHDAQLASEVLERGCADLVLAGHLHVQSGPTRVIGANGEVGYTYTTGTAGGAAYAFALGKPRRDAEITLVTYRDGRPAGIQPVVLETHGQFVVGRYLPLHLAAG
jgi:predicted phosphodiesterase